MIRSSFACALLINIVRIAVERYDWSSEVKVKLELFLLYSVLGK